MEPEDKPTPPSTGAEFGKQVAELAAGQKAGGGRYTLIKFLGKGGMGIVWLARDEHLRDDVALKFLPANIHHDVEALDDMRRETLKSRKLSHPNIIRIHDLHVSPDESPFISMEYIAGAPLNVLKAQQPQRFFAWEYLKPIIKQLCDALDYAHHQKVIHRDLKPANMMLTTDGVLKLADFGIAAVVSDSMSRVSLKHSTSGTVVYMSPQQMNGQRPTPSDDIYALGATMYELLTSKPPFYSGDILHQVQNIEPQPLAERLADLGLSNDIPPDVSAMVMACLSKDWTQRPQSAGAVAEWIGLELGMEKKSGGLALHVSGRPPAEEPAEEAESAVPEVEEPAGTKSKTGLWIGVGVAVLVLAAVAVGMVMGRKSSPGGDGVAAATSSGSVSTNATPSENAKPPTTQAPPDPTEAGFQSLFDGKSLSGWKVPSPNPWWTVSKGILTGRHDARAGGHILETIQPFEDFIIECEARWQGNADSGICVRIGEAQKIQCQIGLSPSQKRDMTAAILVGGNGYPAEAKNLQSLLKPGDWNHFRFQVQGSRYQIWLNGQQTVDYVNESFPKPGPIGLQIMDKIVGMKIEFRNLRVKPLTSATSVTKAPTGAQTVVAASAGEAGFLSLFNGTNLVDWDGDPKLWSVKDGMIVGDTTGRSLDNGHQFLTYRGGAFGDFELRFKSRLLSGNSGVQFRSTQQAGWKVVGYQAEVALSSLSFFGGLCLEGFRPAGQQLALCGEKVVVGSNGKRQVVGNTGQSIQTVLATYKPNDWNDYVVIAQGNHIIQKLNGLTTVDCTDNDIANRALSGIIALQLHKNKGVAMRVEFKDIQIKRLSSASLTTAGGAANTVPSNSTENGFQSLFDGKSLAGWNGDPAVWAVTNGVIHTTVPAKNQSHLVTSERFKNFELRLEYAVTAGANSGIFYGMTSPTSGSSSPEMQLVDDIGHPNGKNPISTSGSLYSLIAPNPKPRMKPLGEFNMARVIVQHGHVEHWLNDAKVVEYEWGSAQIKALIANSNYIKNTNYMSSLEGHIGLQSNTGEVMFRNIRIRSFSD